MYSLDLAPALCKNSHLDGYDGLDELVTFQTVVKPRPWSIKGLLKPHRPLKHASPTQIRKYVKAAEL